MIFVKSLLSIFNDKMCQIYAFSHTALETLYELFLNRRWAANKVYLA